MYRADHLVPICPSFYTSATVLSRRSWCIFPAWRVSFSPRLSTFGRCSSTTGFRTQGQARHERMSAEELLNRETLFPFELHLGQCQNLSTSSNHETYRSDLSNRTRRSQRVTR